MNLVIHFLLKPGKVRELESQKARESLETLLKKFGGNPEEVSQFCRILRGKSLFAKSKLTNVTKSREVGGAGVVQKSIYIKTPSVWSFSGIANTQERRQDVPCMSSTRLLSLPNLI